MNIANELIRKGYLESDLVIDAFSEITRATFTPSHLRRIAELDIPVAIGHGQMIPAPSTIAFMIELLKPARNERILVAGFGSGWISTLLSYIVGGQGHVTSIDIVKGLEEQAVANMGEFHFITRDHIVDTFLVESERDLSFEEKFDHVIVINPMLASWNFDAFLKDGGDVVLPKDNIIHYYKTVEGEEERQWESFTSMEYLPTGAGNI